MQQGELDLRGNPTVRHILDRIRKTSRDETEKGRWFEQLFMRIARQEPDLEIEEVWRWADWPERKSRTGLDGRDIGIDLVARRSDGRHIAVQCKCYDEKRVLPKGDIDSFLGASQQEVFDIRWIVGTCRWSANAEAAVTNANPPVTHLDFARFHNVQLAEDDAEPPVQEPWVLQGEAIEDTVAGLRNHERGRLVMACGTGKTFTSLRIAEQVVENGGRILFAAPTIALVSQARREWLRRTTRPLRCLVVCSDPYAGGRNENEDIRISELECPVTTKPEEIAMVLRDAAKTTAIFCTYHSLDRVREAQDHNDVPVIDLVIADEAHRTTGVSGQAAGKVDFQEIHDNSRIRAKRRLYMTATPRMYTASSKSRIERKGYEVVDMTNLEVYGPEFHRLPFAKAVEAGILSDYRVIVLGVGQSSVTPGLRRRLAGLDDSNDHRAAPTMNDMTRVLGVSLAVNGVTDGSDLEKPGPLPRTMAFANSIKRSKWYEGALAEPQVLAATTRRMEHGRAMKVAAKHLDASSNVFVRNRELEALDGAERAGECRIVCNVKLFTEGVDVPSLNAVAFLDPRDSQVDVVQSVGRVMRRAAGKKFGYIIIPVVMEPGKDIVLALERGTEGYQTVGRVLRALQSHDGRLAEDVVRFVRVYEAGKQLGGRLDGDGDADGDPIQERLDLQEADQGIYAHVAAASGLGKPGQLVADEIADTVKHAAAVLWEQGQGEAIGHALDLPTDTPGETRNACTIGALLLCNACLLHRRLRNEPGMSMILRLDKVGGANEPAELLYEAWETILKKDFKPVFKPALAVLQILCGVPEAKTPIRILAERANSLADSLSELGLDHAGPLYHRILPHGPSDGAFYTNNLSALMLARLALPDNFVNWSDPDAIARLRIMDPACGTGSLLMAALHTIKARGRGGGGENTTKPACTSGWWRTYCAGSISTGTLSSSRPAT